MKRRFEPVEGRNAEIIESVMACREIEDLDDSLKFKIRLCVEEVEENILCYSGTTWVEVVVSKNNDSLTVSFRDGGIEFDPLSRKDPDINAPLEERAVGGLGIFLCKQIMDSLEYRFENRCNIFSMTKQIR